MSNRLILDNGQAFLIPGLSSVQTQFFPGGGLTSSGIWVPFLVDDLGRLETVPLGPSPVVMDAVLTAVPASITSVTALSANPSRSGAIFVNNSDATCWLSYKSVSSPTLFTIELEPGSTYGMDPPIYSGVVSAIWQSATGSLQITEF